MKKKEVRLHLENFDPPKNSSILLDTDIFIDAADYIDEFDHLWKLFERENCEILTLSSNEIEFIKGSKSLTSIANKRSYINDIVDAVLDVEKATQEEVYKLITVYGPKLNPEVPDLYLASSLLRYKGNILLLTANAKDFPGSVFDRSQFFILETELGTKVYSLYKYNETKFTHRLGEVIKFGPRSNH